MKLTFGRYAGGRSAGELWCALESAVKRWRMATGLLTINLDLAGPHFVRWKPAADMPNGSHGFTSGSFENGVRIFMNDEIAAHRVAPVLTHEIGHVLRKNYGHSEEDGSMSFLVTHVDSEPVSLITHNDLDLVELAQGPLPLRAPERA